MRRFVISLLVLVVLSPTMASAAAWYRCAIDGETRADCCCPGEKEDEEQPGDDTSALRPACCCDVQSAAVSPDQVRIAAEGGSAALAFTLPRTVIDVQVPHVAAVLRPVHEVARPSSRAPPLFLANCSLLI